MRPVRLAVAVAMMLLVVACSDDPPPPPAALDEELAAQSPAEAPFEGLGVIGIRVGDADLTVVVADEGDERSAGLRGRTDPAPYDGMLFVQPRPSEVAFTMSRVAEPLDLAFYDDDGVRLGGHEMEPCPSGSGCPSYPPPAPYRYALETPPGELPEGDLVVVTGSG